MDVFLSFGERLTVQPAIFNSVIIVLCLCIFFIICGAKVKKADPAKPSKGLVFFMESVVTGVEAITRSMVGDKKGKFAPFIGFLIFYLLIANTLGLFGLTAPTTNYNVTLSMALFTLTYIAISGIRAKGLWGYLKDTIFGDVPALFLLNIIGETSKIISLSFRLFGNILSGSIMLAVIMFLVGWISLPIMPFLSAYFNIFAGVMQTLIFCVLTMIWLSAAVTKNQ